jgi:serralysin
MSWFHSLFRSNTALPSQTQGRKRRCAQCTGAEALEARLLLYALGNRWAETTLSGSGLTQGDPTIVTWGLADDGSWIWADGFHSGEQHSGSNLVAFLDGLYGNVTNDEDYTDEVWFPIVEDVFTRWSEVSGLTFVYEPNDDGGDILNPGFWFPGVAGVRADIRLSGHAINSGTLAYSYQPNSGDLILNTTHSFFNDTGNDSLKLRLTLAHEIGHSIGLKHSSSSTYGVLMEPTLNTSIDGPQYDDFLGLQRWYGDNYESGLNNSTASPTNLGSLSSGNSLTLGADGTAVALALTESDIVSIDDESDIDVYSFAVSDALEVDITLDPVGPTYMNNSSSFDASAQSDLTLQLIGTDGTTVLATANATGVGASELISGFTLPAAGTFFVKITGATTDKIQTYQLSISAPESLAVSVSLTPGTISESAGTSASTGTVTRNGSDVSASLEVNLSSDDTTEATVPATVTIPANSTSATFPIDAVDDTDADGTQLVTITATATGYAAGNTPLNVTDDDVPQVPSITGPAAVVTEQRPTFTWTASTGADTYDVWIGNQSTGVNPFDTATVSTNSYTPNVDFGIGIFNVWVKATNANGSSEFSTQYNVRITTAVNATPIDRWQTTNRPTLAWNSLPGADHYDVWIDDHLGNVSQYIRDTNVSGTSFTPATDMGIGLYRAWVRGIDASGGAGNWSPTLEFYVVSPPIITGGQNPTFDRTPTFSWLPTPGATAYEVFVRDRNTGQTAIYEQSIAATSWTPASDLPDGPYRWWAIAVSDANVRSYWTDPIDIFVGGRTDVLTPTGTTSDTTPTITWRPVDGAVRYELFVDRVGIKTGYIQENNLTTTSFTPASPLPVDTYRVWVRAVSSTNEVSPWSISVTFTVTDATGGPLLLEPENDGLLRLKTATLGGQLNQPVAASEVQDESHVDSRMEYIARRTAARHPVPTTMPDNAAYEQILDHLWCESPDALMDLRTGKA